LVVGSWAVADTVARRSRGLAALLQVVPSSFLGVRLELVHELAELPPRWALAWLRDDLTAYTRIAGQNNPAAKQFIQQQLTHWRSDPDLASVRDPAALDRLPDNERTAGQALWRDVDELAKRVTKKDTAKK
jgi:hypothetical protein